MAARQLSVGKILLYAKAVGICPGSDRPETEAWKRIRASHFCGAIFPGAMSQKRRVLVRDTESFVREAKRRHADLYDYAKSEYVKSHSKVAIICKRCDGEFTMRPNAHLNGSGCPKCGRERTEAASRDTAETFIAKARQVHGPEAYDYSKIAYVTSQTKILIICSSCEREFWQVPYSHLSGSGCPDCGTERAAKQQRSTTSEFIAKAKEVHGSHKYDYGGSDYVTSSTEIAIGCKKCGDTFRQKASDHLRGSGCPRCAQAASGEHRRMTLEQFVAKAIAMHGPDAFDYSKTEYTTNSSKVTIRCKACDTTFRQAAKSHLSGYGCKRCSRAIDSENKRMPLAEFIAKAIAKHGPDAFDYTKVVYTNKETKVTIGCKTCGTSFRQRPGSHLCGHGCPTCAQRRMKVAYSKVACEWLNFVAKQRGIFIRHAGNVGEHCIRGPNGENYWLDGFCAEENRAYDFHGSMWHAHPDHVADRNARHCIMKKWTNEEVYQRTLQREANIRKMGYELVVMWEVRPRDLPFRSLNRGTCSTIGTVSRRFRWWIWRRFRTTILLLRVTRTETSKSEISGFYDHIIMMPFSISRSRRLRNRTVCRA